jgi:hypothetical protein
MKRYERWYCCGMAAGDNSQYHHVCAVGCACMAGCQAQAGRPPTGIVCCLLRRFSSVLQTTNSWFGVEPARLRRPPMLAAGCAAPPNRIPVDLRGPTPSSGTSMMVSHACAHRAWVCCAPVTCVRVPVAGLSGAVAGGAAAAAAAALAGATPRSARPPPPPPAAAAAAAYLLRRHASARRPACCCGLHQHPRC